MVVSDYSYSKETNPEGVEMAVLSYNTTVKDINIFQKLFCANSKQNTQGTTNHVFETIKIIK